jgi:hypothetical protein
LDFAACVIPEDAWYFIPEREIRGLQSISLGTMRGEANYEVDREAWGLLRKASEIGDPESGAEQPPTAQSDATQRTGGRQRMAAAANYFKRQPERGSVVPKKAEESEARFRYQSIRQFTSGRWSHGRAGRRHLSSFQQRDFFCAM